MNTFNIGAIKILTTFEQNYIFSLIENFEDIIPMSRWVHAGEDTWKVSFQAISDVGNDV